MIEQHHYNTYSSTKYSNQRRTLYLALNRKGQSRKVMLRANQQLGRLSSYTRVLTRTVTTENSEELHPVRHHSHSCTSPTSAPASHSTATLASTTHTPRCRKRKKRKKRKRKCVEGNVDNELCLKKTVPNNRKTNNRLNINSTKKCDTDNSDECQRVEVTEKKKHKTTKNVDKHTLSGAKKRKKHQKGVRNKKERVITTTEAMVTEDATSDEDYTIDTTTMDWEDSTVMSEESTTPRPDWLIPAPPSGASHPSPLFISIIYSILQVVHNCLYKWIYLAVN